MPKQQEAVTFEGQTLNTGDPVVTEVPQEAVEAAQKDPDRLVFMTQDGKTVSQVPFSSFESFWSKKGWQEADQETIEQGAALQVEQGIK